MAIVPVRLSYLMVRQNAGKRRRGRQSPAHAARTLRSKSWLSVRHFLGRSSGDGRGPGRRDGGTVVRRDGRTAGQRDDRAAGRWDGVTVGWQYSGMAERSGRRQWSGGGGSVLRNTEGGGLPHLIPHLILFDSPTFDSLLGVKQGCPLSPTLFGIFIADFQAELEPGSAGFALPTLSGVQTPALFYADDLALVSTTVAGLQAQLDLLQAYSKRWRLTVNVNKTKVVVYTSRPPHRHQVGHR